MFDTIIEFQEVHDDDPCNKLKAAQVGHFQLHTDLIHCKVMSVSFIDKLSVYKHNLGRREFRQFQTLMTESASLAEVYRSRAVSAPRHAR